MLEAVIKRIEVPCNTEKAYEIFSSMDCWWPVSKFSMSAMSGGKLKELTVDAQADGKIVEIGEDGKEHVWATIKSYKPSSFFSMEFHMGDTPNNASLVEVTFTAKSTDSTTVELKHSNWEACGEKAEGMRQAYDFSWGEIFEKAYKSACKSS